MTKQELIQSVLSRINQVSGEIARAGGTPPDMGKVTSALAAMRGANGGSLPPGKEIATAALPVPMDLPADLQPNWDIFWAYFTAINQRFGWPNRDQYLFMAEIAATLTGNAGAALTNPPGGANNYAPIDSPSFTGTVSMNGTPVTFTTWAPYINVVGGQNNYAPLAGPSFTGTSTFGGPVTINGPLVVNSSATVQAPVATDDSNLVPTTAWVNAAIAGGGAGAITLAGDVTGATSATVVARITGTTTGTAAAVGTVGEFNSTGPTTYTFTASATTANVYTASIAAGEWDVWGTCSITTSGTVTAFALGVSSTSATLPTAGNGLNQRPAALAVGTTFNTGRVRFNFSTTTNIYLVGQATYTGAPAISYMMFWRRTR